MNARDELQKVIFGYFGPTLAINAYRTPEQQDRELTEAIIAAGYRKPRTITTAEELDALPFETVIRDADEAVLERWGQMEESGWVTVMVASFIPSDHIALPATVLYSPEPTT